MNQLKMELATSIIALHNNGWSNRRIARELDIDRGTVGEHLRKHQSGQNAAQSTSKPAISTSGSPQLLCEPKPAISTLGSKAGRKSHCEGLKPIIEEALLCGLSAQRIYQDLKEVHGFKGSYQSVKRCVRQLQSCSEVAFRRMECEPGSEAQVDFGQGAWIELSETKRKRPWLFRIVLSYSRKAYSEVVFHQSTENYIRCLENAFRSFGGVPATLVIDNLKAAVTRADWFDPAIHPKITDFCNHYGITVLPTKPYHPRHKGKIEAAVKYAQNNALKGRSFKSLGQQNAFLSDWEARVADTRIHGTTRKQVIKVFEEIEKPKLKCLPASIFPAFEEGLRTVHRDGYVEVKRAYYSVPPEYVGREVWARWETRLVRVYNRRFQEIALHARVQDGKFSTDEAHIHSHKRTIIEKGKEHLLQRCSYLGKHCQSWAEAVLTHRGPQAMRVLQGLLSLAGKHSYRKLDEACRLALTHQGWHLDDIRQLLKSPTEQDQFEFMENHPLIRSMEDYSNVIPGCFESEQNQPEPTTKRKETPADDNHYNPPSTEDQSPEALRDAGHPGHEAHRSGIQSPDTPGVLRAAGQ